MTRSALPARRFFASEAVTTKSYNDTFKASDLTVNRVDVRKIKPMQENQFAFGRLFTDHMLSIDWSKEKGWAAPEILPYGPIKMETSATALHYGISVHEGISVVENT